MSERDTAMAADERRRHPRFASDTVEFEYNGERYKLADISCQGVRVIGMTEPEEPGTELDFTLHIPFLGQTREVPVHGTVVWVREGQMAINYSGPHSDWENFLTGYLMRFAGGI